MITRYNYKWEKPVKKSSPIKEEFELVTIIEPISYNEDDKKTVKEYKEITKWVSKKSLWHDFIKSFDIGSISEQVLNHLEKGTPLITAHTLPAGDYRPESVLKGAEILREMQSKGITLEMLESAIESAKTDGSVSKTEESEVNNA